MHERLDFDHGRGRSDLAEGFTVCAADRFPLGDVGDVDPSTHDISESDPGFLEGAGNVLEGLNRLSIGVPYADDFAIFIGGRGAGDVDGRADSHRS